MHDKRRIDQLAPELRELLQKRPRSVAFVLGSGIALQATGRDGGPVTRWGLLGSALTECEKLKKASHEVIGKRRILLGPARSKASADDLRDVAGFVAAKLPLDGDRFKWIEQAFQGVHPASQRLLKALLLFTGRGVLLVATSYDDLLEQAGGRLKSLTWREPGKLEKLLKGELSTTDQVWRLYGVHTDPQSVLLSESELVSVKKAALQTVHELLWGSKTLVLAGTRDGGPWLQELRARAPITHRDSQTRHYRLVRTGQQQTPEDKAADEAAHIFSIEYGDDYDDLASFLEDLQSGSIAEANDPRTVIDPWRQLHILPPDLREQFLDFACQATWPSVDLWDAYDRSKPMGDRVLGGDESVPLIQRMVLSLVTSVRGSDNMLPILAFVWRLVELAKRNSTPELLDLTSRLADWFHNASLRLGVDAGAIENLKARVELETRQRRELHLVLVLNKGAGDRYLIRAWRVLVRLGKDHWVDEDARQLDVKDQTYGVDEMPALVDEMVSQLLGDLERSDNELTVELFVPLELLLCDADQWPLDLGIGTSLLGVHWRVVVRSLERAYNGRSQLIHTKWQDNWRRLHSSPSPAPWRCTQADMTPDGAGIRYPIDEPPCVALFFTPLRNESGGGYSVLRKLMLAGVPVAVWPRKDQFEGPRLGQVLNELVASNPVAACWREAVRQYRKEAEQTPDREGHPGAHLTVLWDDPFKLLPDALGKARGRHLPKG